MRSRGSRMSRWPWSYSRCQTAQCCSFPRRVAAPGFVRLFAGAFTLASAWRAHGGFGAGGRRDFSNSVPPMRGGWSADRRTLSSGRACDARPPCPGATGTSLGAPPWRFSDRDPRSLPRQWNRSLQRLPAPSRKAWRSGSGPPCVAVRAAAGDATPCSVLQDRLRKTPLHERGWNLCTINSLRSQYRS